MQPEAIYKIVHDADWQKACTSGAYLGSADDKRDGYIHLSAPSQVASTLEKHYFQQTGLLLVRFRCRDLAPNLKWEPSRGGALFPHYYGALPTHFATQIVLLLLDDNRHHQLPELME